MSEHLDSPGRRYVVAALICAAITLLTAPLHERLAPTNIVMVYLLAVVFVAVRLGRGPAVMAAFSTVAGFDFFYVPPRFAFTVDDAQYLLTFAVMLIVALVIAHLAAGLEHQARMARRRAERVAALYEMSRDLSGAVNVEQMQGIAQRFAMSEFGARAALLVADGQGTVRLAVPAAVTVATDPDLARRCLDHARATGLGTPTSPAASVLYLPLTAATRTRGVLAVEPLDREGLAGLEQRRLLDTCASLLAICLERMHYVEVAQATQLEIESERLRSALLGAISHDLRTPLAALLGLSESLTRAKPPLQGSSGQTAHAIHDAARRMTSSITNLLDMARLQSGPVRLNRQWQPIEEIVGSAVAGARSWLESRCVRVSMPQGLPLVHVDAVLMERVLANLLDNAAKYTPAATAIEIVASADEDAVEVRIDDRGPGLPPGREDAIFRTFERGRAEDAAPGVGLGLALCRAVLRAHGGTIDGRQRPGGGARFTLRLPRGEPPQLDVPAAHAAGTPAAS